MARKPVQCDRSKGVPGRRPTMAGERQVWVNRESVLDNGRLKIDQILRRALRRDLQYELAIVRVDSVTVVVIATQRCYGYGRQAKRLQSGVNGFSRVVGHVSTGVSLSRLPKIDNAPERP